MAGGEQDPDTDRIAGSRFGWTAVGVKQPEDRSRSSGCRYASASAMVRVPVSLHRRPQLQLPGICPSCDHSACLGTCRPEPSSHPSLVIRRLSLRVRRSAALRRSRPVLRSCPERRPLLFRRRRLICLRSPLDRHSRPQRRSASLLRCCRRCSRNDGCLAGLAATCAVPEFTPIRRRPNAASSIALNRRRIVTETSADKSCECLRYQPCSALSRAAVASLDRSRPTRAINGILSSQRSTSATVCSGPSSLCASRAVRGFAHWGWVGFPGRSDRSVISGCNIAIPVGRKPVSTPSCRLRIFAHWQSRNHRDLAIPGTLRGNPPVRSSRQSPVLKTTRSRSPC